MVEMDILFFVMALRLLTFKIPTWGIVASSYGDVGTLLVKFQNAT
jgi:hypothetical protein